MDKNYNDDFDWLSFNIKKEPKNLNRYKIYKPNTYN